jgi:acetyl esterase/lipase
MLVHLILGLPRRVLVFLSGGKALSIEGRVLDPRLQFLGAIGHRRPGMETMTPVAARAAAAQGFSLLNGPVAADVDIDDISLAVSENRLIRARCYRPQRATGLAPVLVYYHMGGCVIGDMETCHSFCSQIASRAGFLVVSVDYRLAPEHKFPAAVEDAIDAYRWVCHHAGSLGGDGARVAVGGDSAGGYLSAVICQEMKRCGERQPLFQLLVYPAVDWLSQTASMTSFGSVYPLTAPIMTYFRSLYFNDPDLEALDLRASPGRNPDLTGLAAAFVYTAGFDPLVDQGRDYAEALRLAGVPVLYRCYDELCHAFTAMGGAVPAARAALDEIILDIGRGAP